MNREGMNVFDWRFVSLVLLSFFVVTVLGFIQSMHGADTSETEIKEMEVFLPFDSVFPEKYASDGGGVSPSLNFNQIPSEAGTLAVVLEDTDADKVHWIVWNIPLNRSLPLNLPKKRNLSSLGAIQGENSFGQIGYTGPRSYSNTHTYVLRVYAIESEIGVEPGSSNEELIDALKGKKVGIAKEEFYY